MQRVYSVCSPKPTNDQLALQETVFHNANGYLGVRGTLLWLYFNSGRWKLKSRRLAARTGR